MESEKKTSGGDKYSKLAGNTIIFAISSFSSKLLTLLVQPFLTYAMAEIADLGLAKILSQYANLLIPFVSMGMSNAIIRFGLDKGNSEKQVFTNGLLTILGGFGILILCWPVAQFLPDMAQYGFLIYIYVLMSCLRTLCTQFVRSRQWNKLVAVDGILCTFATLMFYVLYLVGFHWGANGYLLAIISGDLVSVLFLCITGRLWNYVELKGLNRDLWQSDAPLFPAHDPGPDQLLGHQCIGPVLRARDVRRAGRPQRRRLERPAFHRLLPAHHPDHAGPDLLRCLAALRRDRGGGPRPVLYQDLPHLFLGAVLLCGRHHLALPPGHARDEGQLLLRLALCALPDAGFHLQLLQPVPQQRIRCHKKSTHSLWTMLAGAVSNCIMNYFFIKWWGPIGATVASFFGLGIVFVLRALDAHNMIGMSIHPGRVALNFGVLAGEALLLLAEPPLYGLWTGLLTAAIILFNFAGVWAMARMLLPKLLGRRGRALVSTVDNWIKK